MIIYYQSPPTTLQKCRGGHNHPWPADLALKGTLGPKVSKMVQNLGNFFVHCPKWSTIWGIALPTTNWNSLNYTRMTQNPLFSTPRQASHLRYSRHLMRKRSSFHQKAYKHTPKSEPVWFKFQELFFYKMVQKKIIIIRKSMVFMQGNVPGCASEYINVFLGYAGSKDENLLIRTSSQSDLNQIENLWGNLKQRI